VLAHFGIQKYLPTTDAISKGKDSSQYTVPAEELTQWRDAFDLAITFIKVLTMRLAKFDYKHVPDLGSKGVDYWKVHDKLRQNLEEPKKRIAELAAKRDTKKRASMESKKHKFLYPDPPFPKNYIETKKYEYVNDAKRLKMEGEYIMDNVFINVPKREFEVRECTAKLLKLEGICDVRSALEYIGRQVRLCVVNKILYFFYFYLLYFSAIVYLL